MTPAHGGVGRAPDDRRGFTAGPGYITGLGGRDITVDTFKEIAAHALAKDKADEEIVWIGVKK